MIAIPKPHLRRKMMMNFWSFWNSLDMNGSINSYIVFGKLFVHNYLKIKCIQLFDLTVPFLVTYLRNKFMQVHENLCTKVFIVEFCLITMIQNGLSQQQGIRYIDQDISILYNTMKVFQRMYLYRTIPMILLSEKKKWLGYAMVFIEI